MFNSLEGELRTEEDLDEVWRWKTTIKTLNIKEIKNKWYSKQGWNNKRDRVWVWAIWYNRSGGGRRE